MAALEKHTNNYNKNDDEEAALCKQLEKKKKVLTSSDSPKRHVNITQNILMSTFKPTFKDDLSCDTRIAHNSDPSDNNDDGVTDDTLPAIKLSSAQKDHLIALFRYSLIAKVLCRKVRYFYFQQRLLHLWSPMVGILKITELGNGFFLLKFSDPLDCEKVLKGVPWLIDGHYIILSPWVPDFRPSATVISHAVVWVRLPELPIEYYEKEMLIDIASAIGGVVKIDAITERQESGRFARLCIELDLNRPLLPYIKLGRLWQRVEYECLHVICFQCGSVGHLQQHCLQPPSANASPTDHQVSLRTTAVSSCPQETTDASQNLTASSSKHTIYGPWLQVPHRWHQRQRQSAKDQGKQQSQVPSFNIVNRTEPKSSGSRSQVLEKEQILKEPVPSIGKSTMTSVSINYSHTTNAGQKNPLVQKQHLQSGEGTSSSAVNKEAYTQVENMPTTVINLSKPEEAAIGKIGTLLGLSSPPLSNLLEDAQLLPQTHQTNRQPLSHIPSSSNDSHPSITKQEEPSPEQVVSLSPSASFLSSSTAVKLHSYQATNSAIITPPPAQKTSHQGNQPYPLTLKVSPSQLPAMSATSIKLYSEAMQRSVIQCEIDSKPVEMIEPSTEGRPKVFTIKSTISKVDICARISPLPTVNTN